jgi:hypothetical protein
MSEIYYYTLFVDGPLTRTPHFLPEFKSATTVPCNNALVVHPGFSVVPRASPNLLSVQTQQSYLSRRTTLMSTLTSQDQELDAETNPIQYDDLDFSNNEFYGDMTEGDPRDSSSEVTVTKNQIENSRGPTPQTSAGGQNNVEETVGRRIRANVRETGFDSMKYYMKTMGNHDLLQKNEEIILAREIQILIKWEELREELESELLRWVLFKPSIDTNIVVDIVDMY